MVVRVVVAALLALGLVQVVSFHLDLSAALDAGTVTWTIDDDGTRAVAALARQSPEPLDDTWRVGRLTVHPTERTALVLGALGAFLVLVLGPAPRLATRWAWFWLGSVPPLWLVFVLLEPVPLWSRTPAPARAQRLTGGWAFLIGLVLPGVLAAFVPGYRDLF